MCETREYNLYSLVVLNKIVIVSLGTLRQNACEPLLLTLSHDHFIPAQLSPSLNDVLATLTFNSKSATDGHKLRRGCTVIWNARGQQSSARVHARTTLNVTCTLV